MVVICEQNVLVMKLSGIKQLKFSGMQKKALVKLYKLQRFPDIVELIVTDIFISLGILFIAHTYFSKNLISSHSTYSVNVCYAFEHHTCYPLCLLVQQKRTVAALALRANCFYFMTNSLLQLRCKDLPLTMDDAPNSAQALDLQSARQLLFTGLFSPRISVKQQGSCPLNFFRMAERQQLYLVVLFLFSFLGRNFLCSLALSAGFLFSPFSAHPGECHLLHLRKSLKKDLLALSFVLFSLYQSCINVCN